MTVKDLEDLYDYGYWANRQLFEVLANLTPEEFVQDVAGSYGSVRALQEFGWARVCASSGYRSRRPRWK